MKAINESVNKIFSSKRFNVFAFGIIAAMILIAYSNTFTASFHFDDNPSIVENASIKRVTTGNIMGILQGVRPVVYLSLMLNYQLNGLNVVGYHLFNIAVHITNSIFFYLLLLWTLNSPALGSKYREKARKMALFAALLFGVHPIQTESVTYIITRTELLATLFYLGAFLLFIKGASSNKPAYYFGAIISSLFSMGSKEWAVTLPALLMAYDFLFLADGKIRVVATRWLFYVGIALTCLFAVRHVDLFASADMGAGIGFNVASTSGITARTYWLTSLNVIWTYIRLLFLPINQNLDYDYAIAKTLFEFPTLVSFFGHLAVVGAAFWLYMKKGWTLMPFGVAWFYIGLSPVQSIVPIIDVIFEHRVYMPSIGFFIVFVAAYESLFDWWLGKKSVAGKIVNE